MSMLERMKSAPVGTYGKDDDGDLWLKVGINSWDCEHYSFTDWSCESLIADWPKFEILAIDESSDSISKSDLLYILKGLMNEYDPEGMVGGACVNLLEEIISNLGLRPTKTIRVTLDVEVSADKANGVVDEAAAAGFILANTESLVSSIKNVEVVP